MAKATNANKKADQLARMRETRRHSSSLDLSCLILPVFEVKVQISNYVHKTELRGFIQSPCTDCRDQLSGKFWFQVLFEKMLEIN